MHKINWLSDLVLLWTVKKILEVRNSFSPIQSFNYNIYINIKKKSKRHKDNSSSNKVYWNNLHTANVDLLKMVPVEILLNFENYFRTLQLGFKKFLSGIVFLHHYVRTIGLFFSQAHSIWPKSRAFNHDRISVGTVFIHPVIDSTGMK